MGRINYRSFNLLILFIGVVMICSFGLNTVCAADTSTVYVSTHGNDNYDGLSDVYNITSGSGPKATIKNATKTVLTNGTIYISKGTYKENGINIDTNMKLIGENQRNTIINGAMSGSIFSINGANVSLLNLTITNSSGTIGAIFIIGNLTVDNCTFTNNNGTYGGAICSQGTVTINNTILTNNTGSSGGVIYNHLGIITINNSMLTNNTGTCGGVIYNENGVITINNSTILNNTATLGGVVGNWKTLNISNCTIENNTATSGGVVYNDQNGSCTINFNRIYGNTASYGNVICNSGGTVDANKNWWGSNNDPSTNLVGATVDSWLVLTIKTNPRTISNKNNSTVTVDITHDQNGNYFDPNLNCVPDGMQLTLTATKGDLNTSSASLINGEATVIFTANTEGTGSITANTDDQTVDTQIKILDGHIYVSPTGNDSSGDGSQSNPFKTIKKGIDNLDDYGTLHIANGNYNENGFSLNKNMQIIGESQKNTIINGFDSGGCIFTISNGAIVTLINLTLTNNSAYYGGAIYNEGTLTLENCTLTNNSAYYGGAIYNSQGTLSAVNSTFTNNQGTSGGAIWNLYGTMTVDNCTFTNNGGTSGGAICNLGDLNIKHSTLLKNTATNGGAIYNIGTLYAQFNRISGNSAVRYGSAIYNDNGVVNANNNWWGSNSDPSISVHEATIDSWLVLTVKTNPKSVLNGNISTVTIDLTHDQNGNFHDPLLDCVPDDVPVNLTGTKGFLNTISTSLINGEATVIFTANTEGNGNIAATVDNQNVSTQVLIYPHLAVNSTDPKTSTSTNNSLKEVTINFNMPIFAGSYYNNIKITGSSGNVPITVTINGSSLILKPDANYADGTYTVDIPVNAVMDLLCNGLESSFSSSFTVDTVTPTADATPEGGLYNTTKTVTLTTNKPGTIYYTTDGQNPTTDSAKYTTPITINTNTTLKYFAIDTAGNTSPIYTENYIIDTTTPTANTTPKGGLYNTTKTVELRMDEPGTIYYTLDDQDPTTDSAKYTTPITINTTTTLKYFAIDTAGNTSPIYTENYIIDTTTPTANTTPKGGLYNSTKTVTLTTNKLGTIYYTTDGKNPTTDSAKYTTPITINTNTTLKYIAIDTAGNVSPIYTENYIIDTTTPTANTTLKGGFYNTTQTVELSMDKSGTIYCTIDGTTPTTSSNKYTSPIVVSRSETLKFIAVDILGSVSKVYTENYVVDKTLPTATVIPTGGIYNTSKTVALYMSKSGTIYYTLNGKTPTNKSNVYIKPLTISKTAVLKYFIIDLAGNKSPIYTQKYTIDKTVPRVTKSRPTNNSKGVSLSSAISIKFSENVKMGIKYSKIYIKNLSTGKLMSITKTLNKNTLTIKMTSSKLSLNNYQVYMPAGSVKDLAGNKNTKYTLNFKTGKY